jgi:hypothetical protein
MHETNEVALNFRRIQVYIIGRYIFFSNPKGFMKFEWQFQYNIQL